MMRHSAVFLALAVVSLTGCGSRTVAETNDATASPPGKASEIQAAIVTSHQRWAGTADDLQAAQVVRAKALNGEYDSCMQAKGHAEFDFRDRIQLPPVAPDSGLTGLLEPFDQHTLRAQVLSAARSMAIEYRSNHPETAYQVWNDKVVTATDQCLAETESASDEEIDKLMQPAVREGLYAAWYGDKNLQETLLFGVENAKDYASCMQTRGFGDGTIRDSDEASPTLMARLRSEVELPPRADWRTVEDPAERGKAPAWQAFIAAERTWLNADQECRADIVAKNIAEVRRFQQGFEARYASQISQAESGWAAIRAEAAELGWSPNRPFAQ
ncbi:MAG: hypothetical protein ACRCYU_09730 [Nocardioides sp.]